MRTGKLALFLHAHLPFIHHPEHKAFFEEKWLFEAMTETYLPLIALFDEMDERSVGWRLSMSMTPPLAEMLVTHTLQDRYSEHLGRLIDLAGREAASKRDTPFQAAAEMYVDTLARMSRVYHDKWGRDVIAAFRHHQDARRQYRPYRHH